MDSSVDSGNEELTYGLLVFSQVTRSISTVHKDLNRRSCGKQARMDVRVRSLRRIWHDHPTYLLIRLPRPNHIISSEQYTADIPQPLWSDRHGRGEPCIEGSGNVGSSIVGSRVLRGREQRGRVSKAELLSEWIEILAIRANGSGAVIRHTKGVLADHQWS